MKTSLLSLLICFICSIDLPAQTNNQVLENPAYDLAVTERFKISKIELNDTETKVHLEWDIPAGWWVQYGADTFLRDPETGEKYTVLYIENEEFDTRINIDSTEGHHSVFVFPPVKPGLEKIDYNDQFYGLYLNGEKPEKSSEIPENVTSWLNAKLAKVKKEPIQDYENGKFFSKEPAKIIGYIKGYDPRLGFETGIYYASNQLTREDYPVTIEILEDGRFEADIPLIHPVESFLVFNSRLIKFYLEPGQTLSITLNWKDFLKAEHFNSRYYPADSVIFSGNLAKINEELFNLEFSSFNYDIFKDNVLNLSAKDFKKEALQEKQKNDQLLEQYFTENNLLEKTKTILTHKKELITATLLFNYLMYKENFQRQYPDNDILKEKIPIEYYSFIQDLDMSKQSLLISRDFPEFVNRFEYANPLNFHANALSPSFTPKISVLEYFDLQKIPLTDEERNLLKPQMFESVTELEKYQEKRKPLDKKYSEELEEYLNQYVTPFVPKPKPTDYMEPWHKKDSVMANHLRLKNDLIYDITKTRSLKFYVENRITDAEEAYKYWNELSATIENDFVKKEGERIVLSKFPKKEPQAVGEKIPQPVAVKSQRIPLPEGKPKKLFYEIADKYKGKIVFVDFWATTCGPCVGTIKRMKDIRKKYENNPEFEFVFITDQAQSPLEYYNKFTKEQEMKNIHRVDTDIYNRFRQLFQFNGIPRYVVLNKRGELIDGNFQMHNFTSELPSILEKNK